VTERRCPICNAGTMAGTHTRRRGDRLHRYCECNACGYRDRAIIEPERIIKILPVIVRNHTQGTLPTSGHAVT
jgi:hypothetical protein